MPRILQITDSHLTGRPPATPPRDFGDAVHLLCGRTTSDAAAAVCAAAQPHGPFDAILHTGDITDDGSVEGYQAALELLTTFGAPVRQGGARILDLQADGSLTTQLVWA